MIVAHAKGRGIGFRGNLPWCLTEDMARFKRLTMGDGNNAVVMGKKTWLSLSKRPLPGRKNLILSQSLSYDYNKKFVDDLSHPNVKAFPEISDLEKFCRENKYDDTWIIGGGDIYKGFLGKATSIYTTELEHDYECDVYFPEIPSIFSPIWKSERKVEKDINYDNVAYSYVVYKRRI